MRTSDRLTWELDLLDARAVLEGMFDGTPLHLALVQRDGFIAATNAAWDRFCEANGGDPARCGPESNYLELLSEAEAAGAPEAAAARAQLEAAFDGEVSDDLIYPCDGPDEQRTFRTFAVPFPQLEAVLVVHTSVTDERLAAQLHDQLLIGLTDGLRESVEALAQAADKLVNRESLLRDPRVDALAETIDAHARQLQTLFGSLTEFDRIVGTTPSPPTPLVLADLVERVVSSLPADPRRTVVAEVAADLQVVADTGRLELALRQLVVNALNHTPPGTTVRLHTQDLDEQRVELLVDDDGPGIPMHERERLLQPFERGLLDRRGGRGLGLPVVDQLLRRSGERLRIDDRPGGGARLALPLRRADGAEQRVGDRALG
jgi:signal transduction histidine kinase